jgi:(4S)-4-hydroxy-5-phosphonooxypentane-2,3-dione isomerase
MEDFIMHIVLVHIHVKSDAIENFKAATVENARNSLKEPGIVQFGCMQQAEDPSRFTLVEVYRTPNDQLLHRETKHYQVWKDAVADMQAEPRQGVKYTNVYPGDTEWK